MALLFSATDECSRPMVRIIPRHFHWLRKLRSPIFLKALKQSHFFRALQEPNSIAFAAAMHARGSHRNAGNSLL
jgi:hypothetical protein